MAIVTWEPRAITTPQLDTITIGSATAAQTFAATLNGKTVTYVAGAGETTTTVATALYNLLVAQQSLDAEFGELTFATSTNTITATGPSDGTPFTLTVGGTGTIGTATTTAAASPNDAANVKNYSAGALPSGTDTLVFENSDVAVKWNLTALSAIALAKVIRRASYTGGIGLPDTNPAGYREYRTTHLSLNAAAIEWEASPRDSARQFRLNCVTTAVNPFTISGAGATTEVGSEALELKGLVATSVVNVSGASVAIAPLAGQTAAVATLLALDSTVTVGSGTTLTTPTLTGCRGELRTTFGTLTLDGSSDLVVSGAAAGTGVVLQGGRLTWKSSGTPGTVTIGSDGEFSANEAPKAFAVGQIDVYEGFTLHDRNGRMSTPWTVVTHNCRLTDGALDVPDGKTYAVS